MALESDSLDSRLALSPSSYVTLATDLNFSLPEFPHLLRCTSGMLGRWSGLNQAVTEVLGTSAWQVDMLSSLMLCNIVKL